MDEVILKITIWTKEQLLWTKEELLWTKEDYGWIGNYSKKNSVEYKGPSTDGGEFRRHHNKELFPYIEKMIDTIRKRTIRIYGSNQVCSNNL